MASISKVIYLVELVEVKKYQSFMYYTIGWRFINLEGVFEDTLICSVLILVFLFNICHNDSGSDNWLETYSFLFTFFL
ncbi:hypothetical protein Sjap_014953 [Stephania japonica]|uniref:Uncharacterized protein n=1 Tax=Stephania japonica TaxID=461633 RepID=A0AAP0NTI7_9MAGN